jgi:preprotein translocase subunit SecY
MMRMTYVGAAFLCADRRDPDGRQRLAEHPAEHLRVPRRHRLLIVVSVALDMGQRIEANLLMRNYSGFLRRLG